MKTKTKQTGIRAKQKFYNFCVKVGIDVSNMEVDRINFESEPLIFSFKERASEIKKQFNHTFKMREQDFIGDYPNIESVEFIKA